MTERESADTTDYKAMFRRARRYLRWKKLRVTRTPKNHKLYFVQLGERVLTCDLYDVIAQAEALGMPKENTP